MKKLIVLLTIACAGQLYGMEQMIETIKKQPAFGGLDVKRFTVTLSGVSIKFPDATREDIAKKFNAPVAKEYLILNDKLEKAVQLTNPNDRLSHVLHFLEEGADPNFTWGKFGFYKSILGEAYRMAINAQKEDAGKIVVEVLLKAGANPNVRYNNTILFDYAHTVKFGGSQVKDDFGLFELLKKYYKK